MLKLRKRNSVKLAIAFVSGLVLIAGAVKSTEYVLRVLGKAPVDATEVAKIRKEVEDQRDTIGVVAREANAAHAEVQKAAELSAEAKRTLELATKTAADAREVIRKADQDAERLRQSSDFALLLSKASADDRKALEHLIEIADKSEHPFNEDSLKAIQRIVADLNSRLNLSFDWKRVGVDVATVSFSDMREVFDTRPVFDQPSILLDIFHKQEFSKFERLKFVYDVMKATQSIMVLNAACSAMREESKLNYNILGYGFYIDWWDAHAAEYAGVKEYKPEQDLHRSDTWPDVSPAPEISPFQEKK